MRPLICLMAIAAVIILLIQPAPAQCPGGNCPLIQSAPDAVPLADRPVIRAVTAPVRVVVRSEPVQRVRAWRPLQRVRARLRGR